MYLPANLFKRAITSRNDAVMVKRAMVAPAAAEPHVANRRKALRFTTPG